MDAAAGQFYDLWLLLLSNSYFFCLNVIAPIALKPWCIGQWPTIHNWGGLEFQNNSILRNLLFLILQIWNRWPNSPLCNLGWNSLVNKKTQIKLHKFMQTFFICSLWNFPFNGNAEFDYARASAIKLERSRKGKWKQHPMYYRHTYKGPAQTSSMGVK